MFGPTLAVAPTSFKQKIALLGITRGQCPLVTGNISQLVNKHSPIDRGNLNAADYTFTAGYAACSSNAAAQLTSRVSVESARLVKVLDAVRASGHNSG